MSEYIVKETGYPGTIKQEAVQELVRCKDCRWYEIYQLKKDGTEDRRYNPEFCVLYSRNFPDDYFCADGERREDEMPEHEAWRIGDRAECIMLTRGTADKSDDEIAHAEYVWRK